MQGFNLVTKIAGAALLNGLFATQALALDWHYTGNIEVSIGWDSSDGFSGSIDGTCKVTFGTIPDPDDTHALMVGVYTGKSNSYGEVTLGGERLMYDADASKEYNEQWGTIDAEWQFFRSMPMAPPQDYEPVDFDLNFDFDNVGDTFQVFVTNDTGELYGDVVKPALFTWTNPSTPSADINVSGGTTNEVYHSCSTTSAPAGGAAALVGLLALGFRRRRQS
jgi:MYXO-CTERM domain-containing protein